MTEPQQSATEIAERILRQNWLEGARNGTRFAYTQPSPGRYPWQWYWDSCFAAIVWRRFEPERARAELESLLVAQREDGFIGHTIFWDRPVSLGRLPFYNVASRSTIQTETIQPPLLAWAWRIAVDDPAVEPGIVSHAGAHLLVELADRVGLTAALSVCCATRRRCSEQLPPRGPPTR